MPICSNCFKSLWPRNECYCGKKKPLLLSKPNGISTKKLSSTKVQRKLHEAGKGRKQVPNIK